MKNENKTWWNNLPYKRDVAYGLIIAAIIIVPTYGYNQARQAVGEILSVKTGQIQPFKTALADTEEVKPNSPLNVREYVANEVRKAGLNIFEVQCLLEHESNFDNDKYNINNNGTIDIALWQINSTHINDKKYPITLECMTSVECSTKWSIAKRLREGNWNSWYGFKNNCR